MKVRNVFSGYTVGVITVVRMTLSFHAWVSSAGAIALDISALEVKYLLSA